MARRIFSRSGESDRRSLSTLSMCPLDSRADRDFGPGRPDAVIALSAVALPVSQAIVELSNFDAAITVATNANTAAPSAEPWYAADKRRCPRRKCLSIW